MADDKQFDNENPEIENEDNTGSAEDTGGLGNLPPLSDFDSQGTFDSDSDLPPLGDFESRDTTLDAPPSEPAADIPFGGGDLTSDFDAGAFSLQADSAPGGQQDSGPLIGGFQDLAADSDFSPETPDIGPGPGAALDTPIWDDSAFGGSGGDLFTPGLGDTATQAMPTPTFEDFGDTGEEIGGFGAVPGGTPMPQMAGGTGFEEFEAMAAEAAGGPSASGAQPGKRQGAGALMVIFIGLISLGVGMIASQPLSGYLSFVPGNPLMVEMQTKDSTIANLNRQINTLQQLQATPEQPADISPERVAELQNEILVRTQALDAVKGQLDSTKATLSAQQSELTSVERELRERNDEVIAAREFLEELRSETAIVQARQRGLIAEVDRLTGYVGELDEANARRIATKEALEHNIDRLVIQVKESIPLTPEKYDYATRLAKVEALRENAAQAGWVTPELQNEYTSLYLKELELARANDYFFACVPVTDRFGHTSMCWAECLMRGNWAVYYRSLDGKGIGSFENTGTAETPKWGFRQDLSDDTRFAIEAHIVSARIPDFEGHLQRLAERELQAQKDTPWQRVYSSM
ncbi:MAG: hypothetical protein GX130_00230 [Candidatus Hydrogenedens sp.]|nr:hypothetical protein [Candidatus Hydrogenedens sp.]